MSFGPPLPAPNLSAQLLEGYLKYPRGCWQRHLHKQSDHRHATPLVGVSAQILLICVLTTHDSRASHRARQGAQ